MGRGRKKEEEREEGGRVGKKEGSGRKEVDR